MPSRHDIDEGRPDRFGLADTTSIASALGRFVPQRLARWAVRIHLEPDRTTYERGQDVRFTVTLRNRLSLPITVATPKLRLWGWEIDGELEASDELTYQSDTPGSLHLPSSGKKQVEQVWNGRLKRAGEGPDGRDVWELPEAGVHELSVFVATEPVCARDTVEIELR